MNDSITISRRAFAGGALLLGLGRKAALAQGFAGLGMNGDGFAPVVPGKIFAFPADHGPHPDYRIEWWYVTANLVDSAGAAYGAQWTLFRQAMQAGRATGRLGQPADLDGPRRGHPRRHPPLQRSLRPRRRRPGRRRGKAVSRLDRFMANARARSDARRHHRAARTQRVGRGFQLRAAARCRSRRWCCRAMPATAGNRSADRPRIISASLISRRAGSITIDDKPVEVTGQAWMDREWSSQPLASDQTGWDWFSLHLNSGEKLMLYRLRQKDGQNYLFRQLDRAGRPFHRNRVGR